MPPAISEFLKYTAASAAALAIDVSVLALLVSFGDWPYLLAAATSFVTGGVFLYFACVKLVFRSRLIPNPAFELPLFIALGLVGLGVNCLVMFVVVDKVGIHYLTAKGVAAACTFAVNFLLRRNTMFSGLSRSARPCAVAE